MTRVLIKPTIDHPVPKPDGTALDAAGERLEMSSWWWRRARDGDVSITPIDEVKKAGKAAAKPASKES